MICEQDKYSFSNNYKNKNKCKRPSPHCTNYDHQCLAQKDKC
jgi:hypothetical protein